MYLLLYQFFQDSLYEEYFDTKKINSGEISEYLEEYLKKLMKIKEDSINTGYELIISNCKNLYQ